MNSDEYRALRLEIEALKARVRELEEANAELVQKLSSVADYFGLEWYARQAMNAISRKENKDVY